MLEYVLEPNELTGEPQKYKAQVVRSRSYTFDDIANHLIKHNTGLSSSAIYGLWEGIKGAVEEIISDGNAINTELFQAHISIRGVFDGMADGFDGSRHKIRLYMRPGTLLHDIPRTLKVRKLTARAKTVILSVTDIKTGLVNSRLTPGKNIRIIGQRLRINGNDPSCGLYFVPVASCSEAPVKVDPSEFVVNNPSEIIAVIPDLCKGTWNLRLVTQYSHGAAYRRTPYSITFETGLSVA